MLNISFGETFIFQVPLLLDKNLHRHQYCRYINGTKSEELALYDKEYNQCKAKPCKTTWYR